jgi:hypothetical protein
MKSAGRSGQRRQLPDQQLMGLRRQQLIDLGD